MKWDFEINKTISRGYVMYRNVNKTKTNLEIKVISFSNLEHFFFCLYVIETQLVFEMKSDTSFVLSNITGGKKEVGGLVWE